MEKQLLIEMPPTSGDICMMCHFSSECDGCCMKCKKECNSKQICGLKGKPEDQTERLQAWLSIIKCSEMKNLKKYIYHGSNER